MKNKILTIIFFFILGCSYGQFFSLVFNFDTIEPVYIDTTLTSNIWQIGKPQKAFFDSAYTFPNVIVTDTVNFYPRNCISEFVVKTPTFIGNWGGVNMIFRHKYDTDTLVDGGTINVSIDGIVWTSLLSSPGISGFPFNPFPSNDTIESLNDIGFSGKSDGWQEVSCYWNYPPTDTLWIKFKFASDSIQTNKEGWMIDSLIFNYDLGIGTNDFINTNNFTVFPNPTNGSFTINFDNENIKEIELTDLRGKIILQQQTNKQSKINIDNLQSGTYILSVIDKDNKTTTRKIISCP